MGGAGELTYRMALNLVPELAEEMAEYRIDLDQDGTPDLRVYPKAQRYWLAALPESNLEDYYYSVPESITTAMGVRGKD